MYEEFTTGGEPDPSAPEDPTTTTEAPVTIDTITSARISLDLADLNDLLIRIKPFVATKTSITPLRCVRLTMGGTFLRVTANDMAQWASMSLPAKFCATIASNSNEFDVAVDHALLAKTLKSLGKGTTCVLDCQVTTKNGQRDLIVGNQGGGITLPSINPEDMPTAPEHMVDAKWINVTVEPSFLVELRRAADFASVDETRQVLTGVQVAYESDKALRFMATDSYRLVVMEHQPIRVYSAFDKKDTELMTKDGALVRRDFIVALETAITKRKRNPATKLMFSFALPKMKADTFSTVVVMEANEVRGARIYGSRLIDGQAPNYKQLMPADDTYTDTLGLDGEVLHEVLAQVKAQDGGRGHDWTTAPVRLKAQAGDEPAMSVSFKTPDTEFMRPFVHEDEFMIASDETWYPMEAGVNPGFLDGIITTFDIKALTLDLIRKQMESGPEHPEVWGSVLRPIIATTCERPDVTVLLMPIRLND